MFTGCGKCEADRIRIVVVGILGIRLSGLSVGCPVIGFESPAVNGDRNVDLLSDSELLRSIKQFIIVLAYALLVDQQGNFVFFGYSFLIVSGIPNGTPGDDRPCTFGIQFRVSAVFPVNAVCNAVIFPVPETGDLPFPLRRPVRVERDGCGVVSVVGIGCFNGNRDAFGNVVPVDHNRDPGRTRVI